MHKIFKSIMLFALFILFSIIFLIISYSKKKILKEKGTLTEAKKIELNNSIIPSIQHTVQNRYYFIIGFFAYYGFVINFWFNKQASPINFHGIQLFVSILFTFILIHNLLNYFFNASSKLDILFEQPFNQFWQTIWSSKLEIMYFTTMNIFVWLAFYYL